MVRFSWIARPCMRSVSPVGITNRRRHYIRHHSGGGRSGENPEKCGRNPCDPWGEHPGMEARSGAEVPHLLPRTDFKRAPLLHGDPTAGGDEFVRRDGKNGQPELVRNRLPGASSDRGIFRRRARHHTGEPVYQTCMFCKKPLGSNAVVESFPVGRRLAFDAARGRLWVVCGKCHRWNLTPLEERWEAVEDCERIVPRNAHAGLDGEPASRATGRDWTWCGSEGRRGANLPPGGGPVPAPDADGHGRCGGCGGG